MRLETKVDIKNPKNRKPMGAKQKLDKVFRVLKAVIKDDSFHKAIDGLKRKDLN